MNTGQNLPVWYFQLSRFQKWSFPKEQGEVKHQTKQNKNGSQIINSLEQMEAKGIFEPLCKA